uniref:Thyroid peroxidase-like n=1 Tax=Phallusia mammillata TaxID=59560 RepID=A0A6F9DW00_9ASCI|nr:thyroid peroxidase-like [Phallusia mammillata]
MQCEINSSFLRLISGFTSTKQLKYPKSKYVTVALVEGVLASGGSCTMSCKDRNPSLHKVMHIDAGVSCSGVVAFTCFNISLDCSHTDTGTNYVIFMLVAELSKNLNATTNVIPYASLPITISTPIHLIASFYEWRFDCPVNKCNFVLTIRRIKYETNNEHLFITSKTADGTLTYCNEFPSPTNYVRLTSEGKHAYIQLQVKSKYPRNMRRFIASVDADYIKTTTTATTTMTKRSTIAPRHFSRRFELQLYESNLGSMVSVDSNLNSSSIIYARILTATSETGSNKGHNLQILQCWMNLETRGTVIDVRLADRCTANANLEANVSLDFVALRPFDFITTMDSVGYVTITCKALVCVGIGENKCQTNCSLSEETAQATRNITEISKRLIRNIKKCKENDGGCSDLCEASTTNVTCLCKEGRYLGNDGRTCHTIALTTNIVMSVPFLFRKQNITDNVDITTLPSQHNESQSNTTKGNQMHNKDAKDQQMESLNTLFICLFSILLLIILSLVVCCLRK